MGVRRWEKRSQFETLKPRGTAVASAAGKRIRHEAGTPIIGILPYRDGGAVGTWPRGPIGRGSGWNRRITAITVFTPNQESGGYSSYSLTRKKDPEPIRSAISLSVLIFQGEKGVVLEIFFSDVVALGGVDIGVAGEFGDGFNPAPFSRRLLITVLLEE